MRKESYLRQPERLDFINLSNYSYKNKATRDLLPRKLKLKTDYKA